MQPGDLIECCDTGSLGIITKLIDNQVHHNHYSQSYQVFWPLEAVTTYVAPQDVKQIPFNSDDTLDSSYCVPTL
jgi:hypothetical protein